MFEWIISWVSIVSLWVAFGMVFILFLMRLHESISRKLNLKQTIYVLLMPFSYGYYQICQEKNDVKRMYQFLIVIQFVLVIFGLIMLFYTRYM